MEQLNKRTMEFLEFQKSYIEGALKDLYITKRMLLDDMVPEDMLDAFIRNKAERYNGMIWNKSKEELREYLLMRRAEEEKNPSMEEKFNEIFENPVVPTREEMIANFLEIMEQRIERIYLAKRALKGRAEEIDLDMAIRDMAEQLDSLYKGLSKDDFEEARDERVREVLRERMEDQRDQKEERQWLYPQGSCS